MARLVMNVDELDLYFAWLCEKAVNSNPDHPITQKNYTELFKKLFSVEFMCKDKPLSISHDSNRAIDGLNLRDEFVAASPIFEKHRDPERIYSYLTGKCTLFEMMIALASRMEKEIMENEKYGDRTSEWFFVMLKTSNLYLYDNAHYDDIAVIQIMWNLLDRKYGYDGQGGFFYVKRPMHDMRETEIWYQAMWWITEREYNTGKID